ncbi:flagellar basal body-associated protein FliL [Amycolatopsis sacchari]|uniref:DUF1707 domain-containing protein n=1 Tax=Amycolatopsis sacchari TaxID=115433 RepID=A0A1I3SEI0_9PSEU|nr:flagellar basal body-associated protein FliL [Amycolatopsis sacchari]SFJ57135.1 hypothetical protein SAMN05421835_106290 [Amycolatopsis sacchari]
MTWQEELRKLDEDLANGTLSADAYRQRRDQILSAAVTAAPPEAPSATGESDSTQIIEPVSPPSGTPQPPVQQNQPPQQAGPVPPNSEATQVVPGYDSSAERTQAVPPWQGQYQGGAHPAQGMQSPPAGFQQPPAWHAGQADSTPPWGGGDLPPIAPQGSFDWVSQGPEQTESAKSKGGNGKKILFSSIAVVVVAGLAVAVWLLFGRDNTEQVNTADPGQQPPAATSTKALPEPPPAKPEPSSDADALITAPGTPRNGGGDFSLAQLQSGRLLPDTVISALQQGGMVSGRLNTSTQTSSTVGLFSLTLPSPSAATTVANAYADTQRKGGLSANRDLALQGVPVFSTSAKSSQAVFRAVYVLYDRVIIVETFGPDRPAVQSLFTSLLQEQVDHAPPTQRNS